MNLFNSVVKKLYFPYIAFVMLTEYTMGIHGGLWLLHSLSSLGVCRYQSSLIHWKKVTALHDHSLCILYILTEHMGLLVSLLWGLCVCGWRGVLKAERLCCTSLRKLKAGQATVFKVFVRLKHQLLTSHVRTALKTEIGDL